MSVILFYKQESGVEHVVIFQSPDMHKEPFLMGELRQKSDGTWAFYPMPKIGCWEGYILKEIASRLEVLNKPDSNYDPRLTEKIEDAKRRLANEIPLWGSDGD